MENIIIIISSITFNSDTMMTNTTYDRGAFNQMTTTLLRSAMIWQSWRPTSHYRLPLLTRFQPNHNLACLDNRDNLTQL